MNNYPEHEKLEKVSAKSQACGEFLEWLGHTKGITLAEPHTHIDDCYGKALGPRWPTCGMGDTTLYSSRANLQVLLAEFFDIDQKKLNAEKDAMLADFRKAATAALAQPVTVTLEPDSNVELRQVTE